MKNLITPIILIVIAGVIFFTWIDPQYAQVKEIQSEANEYDEAMEQVRELRQVEQDILARRASFAESNITRLEKLLPDNVDNVRLLLDLDAIASKYGMTLRNVSISDPQAVTETPEEVTQDLQSVSVNFAVSASYQNFLLFLEDLERSLRLVDVESVSFQASDVDLYEYAVGLRTYWID
jgi:Tfp pilus assembly protein PilO